MDLIAVLALATGLTFGGGGTLVLFGRRRWIRLCGAALLPVAGVLVYVSHRVIDG